VNHSVHTIDPELAGKTQWELGSTWETLARTTVVRIPRRADSPIAAVRLYGELVWGFDFKSIEGTLHVATSWQQETLLHSVPVEGFSSVRSPLLAAVGSIPETPSDTLHYRRFSEQALWVAGNTLRPGQEDQARVWILPLDGGPLQGTDLPCCTSLMQPVADYMIVLGDFGCWSERAQVWLRVFGHDMRQHADLVHRDRYLPESRAQAINFAARPDGSGVLMVWPAARIVEHYDDDRPVAMHFLELTDLACRDPHCPRSQGRNCAWVRTH
jgi:hypothetical protein